MNDSEKIKNIRKELSLDQIGFASILDMKQGSISDIERGRIGISEKVKNKLIEIGINKNYIENGEIPIIKNKNILREPQESYVTTRKNDGVPVYDIDFTAGNITQFTDFQEKVIGYIDLVGFKKCIAFVKVKGNSMFPTFTAGDLVGLEPQLDISIIEYGQPYGIVTNSGQSLIKIIRRGKDNDNLILRSNNKEFDDIDVKKSEILRLYKAHGPIRDSYY
jgi:phage repressor protein C with HTH and peptisase S24 domain